MSYRFVKVTSFYRNFLDYYFSKKNEIIKKSYKEQLADIMSEGFGWADFFQVHLKKMGVDAHEIIYNAESLQKQWAIENNCDKKDEELLLEQLKHLKPEVIFFQDSMHFSSSFLKELKNIIPSVKKIIGWCCSPFSNEQLKNFRYFDFNFVCSQKFYELFKENNLKIYELNHAFESSLLDKVKENNIYPDTEFIFIGSFILNSDFHDYRLKIIETLLKENINLSIYANIPKENFFELKSRQAGYLISKSLAGAGLKKFVLDIPQLKKSFYLNELPKKQVFSSKFLQIVSDKPLFGIEMIKAVSKSKIGFNSHGGVAGEYAANSRMFEVTGAGSCLITDHKKNISKFFEPDKEILTYNSVEECVEKVKWLLNNEQKREEIAKAGQKRTLKDHNFKLRAELLNEIILKEL